MLIRQRQPQSCYNRKLSKSSFFLDILRIYMINIPKCSEEEQENQRVLAVDSQRQVQLEALDSEIEYNELLISEREGEIQNIEQGISELNEIFRDMGMLVNEQESGIRKYTNKKEKF